MVYKNQIQKAAYNGTDFILFSIPKFFDETRIEYDGLYFSANIFKLFDFVRIPVFTSIGIISFKPFDYVLLYRINNKASRTYLIYNYTTGNFCFADAGFFADAAIHRYT